MTGVDPPLDDPRIRDDDLLLRRAPRDWLATDETPARPRKGAFQDIKNDDGSRGMSLYVERILQEHGLFDTDVLQGRSDLGLVALPAAAIRAAGHTLQLVPHDGPLGPAHVEVPGKIKPSSQKKFVAASEVRRLPSESA